MAKIGIAVCDFSAIVDKVNKEIKKKQTKKESKK